MTGMTSRELRSLATRNDSKNEALVDSLDFEKPYLRANSTIKRHYPRNERHDSMHVVNKVQGDDLWTKPL